METMRFRETKKSSYKIQIFFIVLFLLIGAAITYFAISTEKEPAVIGQSQSNIEATSNIEENDALKDVDEEPVANASDLYNVSSKTISDKTIKKIKANISLPVITIGKDKLTTLNDEIYKKFNDTYATFKKTMASGSNNYTYTVSYKVYDNIVAEKNVIAITIFERMIDDSAKTNSMEKIHTYNINLKDGKVLEQQDVVVDILGAVYKDKIKDALKDYVVSKKMMTETQFTYSYTGLETFYVKENKFHLVFNPGELVNKKHGILDIIINN